MKKSTTASAVRKTSQLIDKIGSERKRMLAWCDFFENAGVRHNERIAVLSERILKGQMDMVILLDQAFSDPILDEAERAKLKNLLAEMTVSICGGRDDPQMKQLCRKYSGEDIFEKLEVLAEHMFSAESFNGYSDQFMREPPVFVSDLINSEPVDMQAIESFSAAELKSCGKRLEREYQVLHQALNDMVAGFEFWMDLEPGSARTPEKAKMRLAEEIEEFEEELELLESDLEGMRDIEGVKDWLKDYTPEYDFLEGLADLRANIHDEPGTGRWQ